MARAKQRYGTQVIVASTALISRAATLARSRAFFFDANGRDAGSSFHYGQLSYASRPEWHFRQQFDHPRQHDDYRGRALQGVGTRRDQILPQFRVQARQGIGTRHNEIRGTSCHPPPPKKSGYGEVTLRSRPSASCSR